MSRLSGVISEKLVDIVERSPDTFGDCEEDGNLLGRSQQMVEASAGEGKVDGRSDGGAVTENLSFHLSAYNTSTV